ncbi:hypothetical protein IFM89_021385 [Coptis chinensis]|uniref:Uncharacterized protein n=1 Tax=Coptis chinensis TaxID=261450 RepID=A0A835IBG2_9MAGN|nr:hypothetical protein IFM89_021385 [Coptis chinensis]
MGTEEDGQSNDNRKRNDATEKSKKGNTKRGTTIMIELNKKWDGNKIRVAYDEKGRPNNRVVRRKLAGMEGALARSKVPLSEFETWHDLPEPLRDDLWEAMQSLKSIHFAVRFSNNITMRLRNPRDLWINMRLSSCVRKKSSVPSREHDDRSVKWLRACQKKNGEFVNDATMEIAEKNYLSNIQVEDGDTFSKMLPNLEISTPKEGDGDFDASEKARNYKKSRKQVKDAIPKMKKTPTNHEFSTPKEGDGDFDAPEKASNDKKSNKQEEKHDLLGSEKARKDNKGKQIKDFGVVAKSKKALPNFEISTPQEKEETLDEMECSIREYGDMLDNTMESSDNIVIPIERELFGEEIELGHFSIEKSDLLDICRMDWLSVSCMTTYMKYLYGSFMSSQERYTFANPSNFTNYGNDDGEKIQHLQHRLGYVKGIKFY